MNEFLLDKPGKVTIELEEIEMIFSIKNIQIEMNREGILSGIDKLKDWTITLITTDDLISFIQKPKVT